jgi:hypothetical protein
MGFDLVDATLDGCAQALKEVRDRDRIAGMLRVLGDRIRITGGGLAAPAVARIQASLEELWKAIKPADDPVSYRAHR